MPRKKNKMQEKQDALEIEVAEAELTDFITSMNSDIEKARNDTNQWAKSLVLNYQWRKGEIGRPNPDLPFKGALDLRYRLSEQFIREKLPIFMNSVTSGDHILRFTPKKPLAADSADRQEMYHDYIFRGEMADKFVPIFAQLANKGLEAGKAVAKITWSRKTEPHTNIVTKEEADGVITRVKITKALKDAQDKMAGGQDPGVAPDPAEMELTKDEMVEGIATEMGLDIEDEVTKKRLERAVEQYQEGAELIEVVTDVVVENRPDIGFIVELQDLIVPTTTGRICDAEWIAHDMDFSQRELTGMSTKNGGKYENVEDVVDKITATFRLPNQMEMLTARQRAEGVSQQSEIKGYIRVRELYCWMKRKWISRLKGDGAHDYVRAVITYCPDMPADTAPLRIMEYPYNHGKWPFEDYNHNYNSDRYYSGEGITDLINGYEKEYNIARNAALNRNTLALSPPILIHEQAGITPSQHRQVGNVIMTKIPPQESYAVMQYPDLASGFKQDAAELNMAARDLVGLPNMSATQNYATPPTAEQVQQQIAPSSQVTSYELMIWLNFLGRIFRQVYELEKQYLFDAMDEDDEAITVPNMQNPGKDFSKITKADFKQDYIIMPGGDLTIESPIAKMQKTAMAFQMALAYPQIAPVIKPYDLATIFFNRLLGYETAQQFLRDRSEVPQFEQQFMQMQAQMRMMQQKGKGKKTPKIKEVPNAGTGIVPKPQG